MPTINDPIYGVIPLTQEELNFINDCRWVQRMHRIRQTGILYYIFPGASHSRFSHSLGVMYLAGLYAEQLQLNQADKKILKFAGLLHDIGHGPFSHTWDYAYNIIHNKPNDHKQHDIRREEILNLKEMKDALKKINITENDIIKFWNTQPYNSILQGPMGCDRFDYILRDSYFCGTNHFGTINYKRIISYSYIDYNKKLHYSWAKIKSDMIQASLARSFQYQVVYHHHANVDFENVLKHILVLYISNFFKEENLEIFLNLCDDYILIHSMTQTQDMKLKELSEMIFKRKTPDTITHSPKYQEANIDLELNEFKKSCKKHFIILDDN